MVGESRAPAIVFCGGMSASELLISEPLLTLWHFSAPLAGAFLAATLATCVTCVTCVATAFAAGGRGRASSSLSDNSEEV